MSSSNEVIVATVQLGARSRLRVAVNDGRIIIRKYTSDGRRVFLPTGLVLNLGSVAEARDLIAGVTKALTAVAK